MNLFQQLELASKPATPVAEPEKRQSNRKVFYADGPRARPGEARYRAAMGTKWVTVPEVVKAVGYDRRVVEPTLRRYAREGLLERRLGEKKGASGRPILEWRWLPNATRLSEEIRRETGV